MSLYELKVRELEAKIKEQQRLLGLMAGALDKYDKALKACIQMRNFSSPKKLVEAMAWVENDELAKKMADEAFTSMAEYQKYTQPCTPIE